MCPSCQGVWWLSMHPTSSLAPVVLQVLCHLPPMGSASWYISCWVAVVCMSSCLCYLVLYMFRFPKWIYFCDEGLPDMDDDGSPSFHDVAWSSLLLIPPSHLTVNGGEVLVHCSSYFCGNSWNSLPENCSPLSLMSTDDSYLLKWAFSFSIIMVTLMLFK